MPDAEATVRRILPLLLFLGTVIVLAELTAEAEVFDVAAARVALTKSTLPPTTAMVRTRLRCISRIMSPACDSECALSAEPPPVY